jgi:ABC-2 type transport system permease protein
MSYIILIINELKKLGKEIKRYYFEFISGTIIMFGIFLALFFGLKNFAGDSLEATSLDSLIVGYILWGIAMQSFQSVSSMIWDESQKGTLEKLYLSHLGIEKIFLAKVFASILFTIFFNVVILFLAMLITGRWLNINYPFFIFMIIISVISLVGIGFAGGGIAIIHKKVTSIFSIFSFGIIGLMALTTYPMNVFSFLPYVPGAKTLIGSIVHGQTYPLWWYGFIFVTSLVYLVGGLYLFKIYDRKARKMNKLGVY